MPYARRRFAYARRPRPTYRRRNVAGFATRPRMMPKTLAMKRMNQVSTKVFWFKQNGVISPDTTGRIYSFWTARGFNAASPTGWSALRTLYDQYKVLAIKVRFFPANVGIEPDTALFANSALLRGDTISWTDQRFDTTAQAPTAISQVINNASARMTNSRRSYSRQIFRPTGYPEWGQTSGPPTVESWNGAIETLTVGATPATPTVIPVLWYYTVQWKIIVRGRHQP